MKKTKMYCIWTALIFFFGFFAASNCPLFGQSAPGEKAKEEFLKASEQATTETLAKVEQQLTEALKAKEAEQAKYDPVLKTYSLKYISVAEFTMAARLYVLDYSGSESALTVRIYKMNIPAFEDLLKKLDVEKRNIQFQIYTIMASKDLPSGSIYDNLLKNETKEIENKDLKRVLDEMKGLWNFKHYWADSPSYLTMKDGSGLNSVRLVSDRAFFMDVTQVRVRGEEPGRRTISVGRIQLSEPVINGKSTIIDTRDVNFKEKGYLVVGVSGFGSGWSGAALILIINAEIK